MNLNSSRSKGFTLIELLVVVSIISLLASVILSSLNSARAKARDSKRFEDMHQFQVALDLYYSANGTYPIFSQTCWPETVPGQAPFSQGWAADYNFQGYSYETCQAELQTKLSPYIAKLPVDPINNPASFANGTYWYGPVNNGQGYALLAGMEVSTNKGDGCYYPTQPYGLYCIGENWH